jgi:hypothetical protein
VSYVMTMPIGTSVPHEWPVVVEGAG